MTVGGLGRLAGARVPREIRWAVLLLVQEQVELRAHWTEGYGLATWSLEQKCHSRFSVDNLIAANAEATKLHADLLEAGTKVIR